jgi:putative DNA primase/helicase
MKIRVDEKTPARPPEPQWDNIPDTLIVRSRWLDWNFELRDGKPTKVPFERNGLRARWRNPVTWSPFEFCQIAYDTQGFDGVGFVLNDDGVVGVDFDKCYYGGIITIPKIADYIRALDTYTEISPRGAGLRLFLFGKLPPDHRKIGDIEVYSDKRFVSVTGWHLPCTPRTINARQAELDAMHASVFAERITKREAQAARAPHCAPCSSGDADLLSRARRRQEWREVLVPLRPGRLAG